MRDQNEAELSALCTRRLKLIRDYAETGIRVGGGTKQRSEKNKERAATRRAIREEVRALDKQIIAWLFAHNHQPLGTLSIEVE